MNKQYTFAEITEKAGDGSFTAIASTATKDRHGEVVSVDGWDLKNFKKNPVLLWAHDHTIPAIGRATKVWVTDGKLMFKGVWQDITDMGKAAKQLVDEGIINSFSVGFLPSDMEGNKYLKQELLEISLVNVPANPDAMMQAFKSLKSSGFDDDTIKGIGVPVDMIVKLADMEASILELNNKVETLVKASSDTAPVVLQTRQGLTKVVVNATDKLLAGEKTGIAKHDRIELTKVIKRASELLSKSHKGEIHG
jgi:HK97 family phage prohead protease